MKYIVVVDCASSGQMYIDDIINMGYKPLVIYTPVDAEHAEGWSANIASVRKGLGNKAEIIDLPLGYDEGDVLARLEKYDIACCVPGTDPGVRLADKINKRFGLRGNDPETTYLRCTKKGMDEALTKAGIRHILTAEVKTDADIRSFWNDNNLHKAVLKFSESAGTVGLKICSDLEECVEYFKEMAGMYTMTGFNDTPILMQEFIGGTEYIVNSVSIDGKHKITDIWRYEKFIQEDGVLVYDTCNLVDRLTPGMQELLQYAYKVLDAVDMQNGFCHSEYKIDHKGPVLIETNARPMGGNLTREFLDEVLGSHMTDNVLKSLLEPTFFPNFMLVPYLPRKSAMFKFSIVPRDVTADLGPFFELVRHLDSFREIVYFGKIGAQKYVRTIDLETSPFFIRMANTDYGTLRRDYELLRNMEERYFDMVFSKDDKVASTAPVVDIQEIASKFPLSRKLAIITDTRTFTQQYGQQTLCENWEVYDGAIFAMCNASTLTDRFRMMMKAMSQVRKGGIIIITPESYQSLPYGMVGAEVLMTIMGFNAEIPPSTGNGVMYGIKR